MKLSIVASFLWAFCGSASAQGFFETQGRVTYITYFGSGGPRSGETIVASQDAPGRGCGFPFGFVARIGYPASDTSLAAYVHMHTILLRAYVHQRPIKLRYVCGANLAELVGVQEIK